MQLVHIHTVDENTFSFFVHTDEHYTTVKILHFTDFTGTELEKDFPNGSSTVLTNEFDVRIFKTQIACVNRMATLLLKEWAPLTEFKQLKAA